MLASLITPRAARRPPQRNGTSLWIEAAKLAPSISSPGTRVACRFMAAATSRSTRPRSTGTCLAPAGPARNSRCAALRGLSLGQSKIESTGSDLGVELVGPIMECPCLRQLRQWRREEVANAGTGPGEDLRWSEHVLRSEQARRRQCAAPNTGHPELST